MAEHYEDRVHKLLTEKDLKLGRLGIANAEGRHLGVNRA
jgi:hypothetical protein